MMYPKTADGQKPVRFLYQFKEVCKWDTIFGFLKR